MHILDYWFKGSWFVAKKILEANCNQQLRKKRFGPSVCAVMTFVGAIDPYKKGDEV